MSAAPKALASRAVIQTRGIAAGFRPALFRELAERAEPLETRLLVFQNSLPVWSAEPFAQPKRGRRGRRFGVKSRR